MNEFQGYGPPKFTPIPDDFLDKQMANLTGSEVKVMLYIFRRTYGFKKSFDAISYSQFLRGVGELDQGAGVSRTQLNQALKTLERHGYIFRHALSRANHDATVYELNIDGVSHWPDEVKTSWASAKNGLAPSAKNGLAPSAKNDLPLVRKTAQQETDEQKTEEQHTELECVLLQAGVSSVTVRNLAAKAEANNRNTGYVAQWVKWIALQADIRNPGAYLAGVIEKNAEPPQELFKATTEQAGAWGWGGAERARKAGL